MHLIERRLRRQLYEQTQTQNPLGILSRFPLCSLKSSRSLHPHPRSFGCAVQTLNQIHEKDNRSIKWLSVVLWKDIETSFRWLRSAFNAGYFRNNTIVVIIPEIVRKSFLKSELCAWANCWENLSTTVFGFYTINFTIINFLLFSLVFNNDGKSLNFLDIQSQRYDV